METSDKILLYGVGGLVVYYSLKNTILKPVMVVTDAIAEETADIIAPFQDVNGLSDALQRAGFSFHHSDGATFVFSKDGSTTWRIDDDDLERTKYIKRRLNLAEYTLGSDSWVFS